MKAPVAALAAIILAACSGAQTEAPTLPDTTSSAVPGGTIDLPHMFMIGGGGVVTWRLDPAGDYSYASGAGLGLSSAGLLTLPDCRFSNFFGQSWPWSVTVQAMRDSTVALAITITVDERLISSTVACYIPSGETLCHDPALGVIVETGTTLQLYRHTRATCTDSYSPALPVGACPAGDPAFDFCRL